MTTCTIIGNVNVDLIVRDASQLPPAGTEQTVDAIELRVGGAAANSALALARLGGTPRLVGCVGDDHFGRYLVDALEDGGVATTDLRRAGGAPTGASIAFESPSRDRSFLISLGALATFDSAGVPEESLRADFVLVCGYFLHPLLRGTPTQRILEAAHAAGALTLLDTGWDPKGWPQSVRDEVRRLLPLVDVFVPNEAESRSLTGEDHARSAAEALQRVSGGSVVVKLGSDGCLALVPGGEEVRVPAVGVRVSDTTGAGDAFNAGLVFAMGNGQGIVDAAEFATRVASTVVSRPSTDRYPTAEAVLRP